jgi:hypothetical protein
MIDPLHFTKYDRTQAELEELLLFSIMVAGKRADLTVKKLETFLQSWGGCEVGRDHSHPFHVVRCMIDRGQFGRQLRKHRVGQYRRIGCAFRGAILLDPRTCTVQDLEKIPGIGPKTARMFVMHSRPGQQYAALDTHVLTYLRKLGVRRVPKTTPPAGANYRRLEQIFVGCARALGMSPADLDLMVWKAGTKSFRKAA